MNMLLPLPLKNIALAQYLEWDTVRYFVGDVMFAMRGENNDNRWQLKIRML